MSLSGGSEVCSAVTPAFPRDRCFPGRERKSLLWADLTSHILLPACVQPVPAHVQQKPWLLARHNLKNYSNIRVCNIKTRFL